MRYTEYPPAVRLLPYVECLLFAFDDELPLKARQTERVLPDGCMEWIFHLASPFRRLMANGTWDLQPRSFVVGELTRHLLLQPGGPTATMGIRFRPGGAYRFLPFSLNEFTNNSAKFFHTPFGEATEIGLLSLKV